MNFINFDIKNKAIHHLTAWWLIFERKLSPKDFEGRITPEMDAQLLAMGDMHEEMQDTFRRLAHLSDDDQTSASAFALVLLERPLDVFLDNLPENELCKLYAMVRSQDVDECWKRERMIADFAGTDKAVRYLLACKIYKHCAITPDDYNSIGSEKTDAFQQYCRDAHRRGLYNFDYAADTIDAVLLGKLKDLPIFKLHFLYGRTEYLVENEAPAQLLVRLEAEDIMLLHLLLTANQGAGE